MALSTQLIVVKDETTAGMLSPTELFNLAWGLNYQAQFHYGRSPWVERGLAPRGHVQLLPKGATAPSDAWTIYLQDISDEPGALGYHEDQGFKSTPHSARALTAHGMPYSKVFVQTARTDGVEASEVASHEMLEMLVDPWVADESEVRKVLNEQDKNYYIVEVGDPVQGNGYDVGAPEGRTTGVIVADFAWPRWWGLPQTRKSLSFRKSVKNEFEVAPEGYMSIAPESNPTQWSQIYGSNKEAAKAAADAYESPGKP
jgi:hypothetical protein